MTNKDIQKDRERIKKMIERKIEASIDCTLKRVGRQKTARILNKLKSQIIFLIDNPNYKRKTENPPQST